jgi:DNA-binding Lrp family transcriptional regulator
MSARLAYPGEETTVEFDGVGAVEHFGNLKGSNEFKTSRLGAVVGSRHYGDGFIKKWGALMGENVERGEEKGVGLSYGEAGDKIHRHMTEHEVAQALLRFGRDGNGAVVYVATSKIPDWIPREATVEDSDTKDVVKRTRSDAEREVIREITDEGRQTAGELSEVVDVTRRQVYNITEKLEEEGLVERENIGNGYEFAPTDDAADASDLADLDLDDLEVTAVDPSENRFEEARIVISTWYFEPPASSRQSSSPDEVDTSTEKVVAGSNGGGRPPDDT